MTTLIITESGTRYYHDERKVVRYPSPEAEKFRRDGDALTFVFWGKPVIGRPMVMFTEPLGNTPVTMRTTTPVASIEEVD